MQKNPEFKSWSEKVESIERMNKAARAAREAMKKAREREVENSDRV